jgi:hypothetical protein
VNREHRGTHTSVESESLVKLSRRMIDLRSGPAHVGKHDDRTATQTTEDLAGALTSDGLPQRREQLREPAQFLHGESVAVKNTPATTSPTVAGNGTSMEQHSILSLLQRQAGADRDDRLCTWAPCLPPIQIGEMHASDRSWQQRRNSSHPTTFGVGRAAPASRPAPLHQPPTSLSNRARRTRTRTTTAARRLPVHVENTDTDHGATTRTWYVVV